MFYLKSAIDPWLITMTSVKFARFAVTVNEQDINALIEFVLKRGGNITECFELGEETRETPGEGHESSASQKNGQGGYHLNVLHNVTWISLKNHYFVIFPLISRKPKHHNKTPKRYSK